MRYVKQIKVFRGTSSEGLAEQVNEFLAEREYEDVLEIKGINLSDKPWIGVMVVYREKVKT